MTQELIDKMCAEDAPIIEPHAYNFSETIEQSIMVLESGYLNMQKEIRRLSERVRELEQRSWVE